MCGIVGFVHRESDRPCDEATLLAMRDSMVPRGPDDAGHTILGNVALGHRRLSVIDIAAGHQPMSNEERSLWITYNGEIYNFLELREELIGEGYKFRTRCDTEVLIQAYDRYGPEFLSRLNGMFAFAIWDARQNSLFMARDRLGKKPLYYTEVDGTFLFASEIKALLEYEGVDREVHSEALAEFVTFNYVAGERTLFRGIRAVPPGYALRWQDGRIDLYPYWDIDEDVSPFEEGPDLLLDRLDSLLQDAVTKRLISDVPLGTLNSGGIDSSLVTAMVARHVDGPVHSFSVGFDESDYDERSYARILSKQYNTNHHEIVVSGERFAKALPKMIYYHDEPLNHPNSVMIYYVSRLAKEFVTVVLTGEGADELFAGYPRYLIPPIASRLRHIPFASQALGLASRIASDHRPRHLGRAAGMSDSDAKIFNAAMNRIELAQQLLTAEARGEVAGERERLLRRLRQGSLAQHLYLDLKTYLVSILMRQDKMSMATSIESRVPYLDYRVVEFAYRVPPKLKQRRMETKHLLKEVARRYLPETIVGRRKSGFGVPLDRWFRDPSALGRYADLLREPHFPFFEPGVLDPDRQDAEILWGALNLELWYRIFIERSLEPHSPSLA
jgi:asparagine synthase (glutamine-hydrolysing)